MNADEVLLGATMKELRQMREERVQQQRQQKQLETALRLRDEELQRLQEHHQLTHRSISPETNPVMAPVIKNLYYF